MFGVGLGGFVDGIVLHQILQWHHMVSATESHPPTRSAGLEVNTLADGFFHAFTWFMVLGASIVTIALWRQGRLAPSWRFHAGGVLIAGGGCSTSWRDWWITSCSASTTCATTWAAP